MTSHVRDLSFAFTSQQVKVQIPQFCSYFLSTFDFKTDSTAINCLLVHAAWGCTGRPTCFAWANRDMHKLDDATISERERAHPSSEL